jgi:hypothetical protein
MVPDGLTNNSLRILAKARSLKLGQETEKAAPGEPPFLTTRTGF